MTWPAGKRINLKLILNASDKFENGFRKFSIPVNIAFELS